MEEQKVLSKKTKREIIKFHNVEMEKEIITNIASDESEHYKLYSNNKEFEVKINWDNSRNKWHAIIYFEGKTRSLSFFERKIDAKHNINLWILIALGVPVPRSKVGD